MADQQNQALSTGVKAGSLSVQMDAGLHLIHAVLLDLTILRFIHLYRRTGDTTFKHQQLPIRKDSDFVKQAIQ